jgi:hypothetical protein
MVNTRNDNPEDSRLFKGGCGCGPGCSPDLREQEGPSADDLARFSDEYGYCPECGEEVWDVVEFCPSCRATIGGRVKSEFRTPRQQQMEQRWIIVLILILVFGFAGGYALLRFL